MADHSFHIETHWEFKGGEGLAFSRDHLIMFPGKVEVHASAAPGFDGNAAGVNPEELFVASLSSCQMLTYLYLCFKNKMKVAEYEDRATGELARESAGKFWMKTVTLSPKIRFEGAESQQSRALAIRLVHEAHATCFIAQSVKTTIGVEPT